MITVFYISSPCDRGYFEIYRCPYNSISDEKRVWYDPQDKDQEDRVFKFFGINSEDDLVNCKIADNRYLIAKDFSCKASFMGPSKLSNLNLILGKDQASFVKKHFSFKTLNKASKTVCSKWGYNLEWVKELESPYLIDVLDGSEDDYLSLQLHYDCISILFPELFEAEDAKTFKNLSTIVGLSKEDLRTFFENIVPFSI